MKCRSCGAHANMPLTQAVSRMGSCKNCLIDMSLDGQWTGTATAIKAALTEKHGQAAVEQAFSIIDLTSVEASDSDAVPPLKCRFCGAEEYSPLAIDLMASCNNCKVDIAMHGNWTGVGWRIFLSVQPQETDPP